MQNTNRFDGFDFEILSDADRIALAINDFAEGNNDLKEISDFCRKGNDINAKIYKNKNIPYLYEKKGITMLHYFAYHGLPGFVNETIKQYKTNEAKSPKYGIFHHDSAGMTALHYTCSSKDMSTIVDGNEARYVDKRADVIKILINEGFKVNWVDNRHKTPFDTLINGFPTYNTVKAFVENGAKVRGEYQYTVDNKLKRVSESLKDYLTTHEKAICHKSNDLFAAHFLLKNSDISAKDKIILDKISVCNTEHITDFEHAKQKFDGQFLQSGSSQSVAERLLVELERDGQPNQSAMQQEDLLVPVQDNRTAKPVTLESIWKDNIVPRFTGLFGSKNKTIQSGNVAQSSLLPQAAPVVLCRLPLAKMAFPDNIKAVRLMPVQQGLSELYEGSRVLSNSIPVSTPPSLSHQKALAAARQDTAAIDKSIAM